MGPTTLFYFALIFVAIGLSFLTRDWRLKVVVSSFAIIWATTHLMERTGAEIPWLDPIYTFSIVVLVICIQARGEKERRRGDPLAMWLMVILACELGMALAYPAVPIIGNLAVFLIVQVLFVIEIGCVIAVALNRLSGGPPGNGPWFFAR